MSEITRRATFYSSRTNPVPKMFHIEVDGAVINIEVGLTEGGGLLVTRVDVTPDDEMRGGDGSGRYWKQDGARIVRMPEDWRPGDPLPWERPSTVDAELAEAEGR